jgi:predicted nucleotidyltransferase
MKQSEVLHFAVEVLERLEIPYALVGSFASGAYGEPRFTHDIDILVDLKRNQVDALCDSFPADEFYISRPTVKEAVYRRRPFNVIHTPSANKLDFMLSRDDNWGRSQIARRRQIEVVDGCHAFVASPEDVILGKLVYYREGGSEKHLRDITGILKVNVESVDREYVRKFAEHLQVSDAWDAILDRLNASDRQ